MHSYEVIKMMEELQQKLSEQERTLLWLSERLTSLDQRISQLERPTLMYQRPKSEDYETIAQTLDYLHNNVEGIKKDLLQVAKTV
jgi:predicted nuclease with TOPRIM domain